MSLSPVTLSPMYVGPPTFGAPPYGATPKTIAPVPPLGIRPPAIMEPAKVDVAVMVRIAASRVTDVSFECMLFPPYAGSALSRLGDGSTEPAVFFLRKCRKIGNCKVSVQRNSSCPDLPVTAGIQLSS